MLEKKIESHLREGIRNLGGLCLKFTSPSMAGVPDRIILLKGRIIFVELKSWSGHVTPIQTRTHEGMRNQGADVRVLKGLVEVKKFLEELRSEI